MKRHTWARFVRTLASRMGRQTKRRAGHRLSLEKLEDRLAPATFIWSGAGADTNWSTGANWVGGNAPTGSAASLDTLVFPSGVANFTSNNNLPAVAGGPLPVFGSITISGPNYNLTGNKVVLGDPSVSGSGSLFVNAGATNERVSFDIQLGAAAGTKQFFTVNSGGDLTISGALSGNTGTELTKEGTGTLILAANNSDFTGPISLNNNSGVLAISHPNALGDLSSGTSVGTNSQLQLRTGAGTVPEALILNGPGISNDGALQNASGNNTWAGAISLDSNSTIGAVTGTTMTITGQVGDLGSGHDLTKEGFGKVILARDNTYRGLTSVNDGTLTIRDPLSLGASGTAQNGTVVNQSLTKTGTLEMLATGAGFKVLDEQLILNGVGVGSAGALLNSQGNNTWAAGITLGSPAPNGLAVRIGAADGTTLIVSGVVTRRLAPDTPLGLTKVGPGKLVFNNTNTYATNTTVLAGILNIRDSGALSTGSVSVSNGATLQLEIDTGFDEHGRNLSNDSVTGIFNKLRIASNALTIAGNGFGGVGALHSLSGINVYASGITINGSAAIGVDPDPFASNSNQYFISDYSLTVTGTIGQPVGVSSTLVKVGTGQLILPSANAYTNTTLIQQGWITIQNAGALGPLGGGSDTIQPAVTVSAGAALHLKPLAPGNSISFIKPLVLSGNGITHPFALISGKGALMSLGGDNIIGGTEFTRHSDIRLNGQAGIGVELLGPDVVSSLTVTSSISDGAAAGGINKLGSRLLVLQGDGTYSGDNTVSEGVLRVQNNTALGTVSTGTAATGNNSYSPTTTTLGRGTRELQSFTVGGTPGTFTLTFDGQTTAPLAFDVPASGGTGPTASVQNALNALSSIFDVGGSVSVNQSGNVYTVTFGGSFVGFNQPTLTGAPVTGATSITVNTLMDGDGTALELQNSIPWLNGGGSTGMNIWYETLAINSVGNTRFGDGPLSVQSNDNQWRGGLSLVDNTTIQVAPSARLTVFGRVDDDNSLYPGGSSLTVGGGGKLALGGSNTFQGTMFVNQGTLVLLNSQALGGTGVNEIQTVTLTGLSLGTFTLTLNGSTTAPLDYVATAAQVEAALNALPSVVNAGGSVSVTRTFDVFTITFLDSYSSFDVPQLIAVAMGGAAVAVATTRNGSGGTIVADGASIQLQGSLAVTGEPVILQGRGGPDAATVQRVTPSGLTTGTFTLTFGSQTTPALPYGATLADVRTELNNLPSIGGQGGSVAVTGLGVAEVQQVIVTGGVGTFTLTFNGQTTAPLAFDVPASGGVGPLASVQNALNALSTIGGVGGSVTVTGTPGNYSIAFGGQVGVGDASPLIGVGLGGAGVTVNETTKGSALYYNIAFVGTFAGTAQPLLDAVGAAGTTAVVSTFTNVPLGWFQEGPAPNNNWPTPGNQAVTGRVTAVATDPTDSTVIFISTAAGGVWKSKNDGRTWLQLFDLQIGQSESQTVTVTGPTFTLTFNGATTVALPVGATARQVQQVLNELPTIGGVGGSVAVTQVGNVYTVTFSGGSLGSVNVPLMTAAGATIGQGAGQDGIPSSAAAYIGAIAIDTARTVYIGTGEASNLPDSFGGTGMYKSTDAGVHWSLVNGTEVQSATVRGTGTFTLNFKGSTTAAIPNNATEAQVKAALDVLPTIAGSGATSVIRRGLAEVQTITVISGTGTFTLTFNGQTTPNLNWNATPAEVATALNALSTIGGAGGVVLVTGVTVGGLPIYTVTITGPGTGTGAGLGIFEQPLIQATNTTAPPGANPTVTRTVAGGAVYEISFTGALANADQPVMVAAPSGANASASVAITAQFNPHNGNGFSRIIVDNRDTDLPLYASTSDAGVPRNEVQSVAIGTATGATFTLSFTGQNATGAVVNLTTTSITNAGFNATTATRIRDALNALGNIGGIGGIVSVTLGLGVYVVTFGGVLANTNVTEMTVSPGPTTNSVTTTTDGRAPKVFNGNAGNAGAWRLRNTAEEQQLIVSGTAGTFTVSFPGGGTTGPIAFNATADVVQNAISGIVGAGNRVYVSVPASGNYYTITFAGGRDKSVQNLMTAVGSGGATAAIIEVTRGGQSIWYNLTAVVSANRATSLSTQPNNPPTAGANPYSNPPRTPGPDDDYRVSFGSTNTTWSDIALVYTDITNTGTGPAVPVLYAAQGSSAGGAITTGGSASDAYNGVFWSRNPLANHTIWYEGTPGGTDANPATSPTGVDARGNLFPMGRFPIPNQGVIGLDVNGNIKISAVAGTTLTTTTVYASVARPDKTFRGLYRTTNGGHAWTQIANVPDYMAGQGDTSNAILAITANNVIVGGYEADAVSHARHILITTDGGATWIDNSGPPGAGPHTGTHNFFRDSLGRILVATDGGVWRRTTAGAWEDINGNLAISQINGVAQHPTDLGVVVAGIQSNGTAVFNNNLNWRTTDGFTGGQVRIDPKAPNNVYHVLQQQGGNAIIRASTNGGQIWTTVLNTQRPAVPLVLDSQTPSRLLVGGTTLQETSNRGASWTNLNVPAAVPFITAVAIATFQGTFKPDGSFTLVGDKGANVYDPDTIYVTNGTSIGVTKNHGVSWATRGLPGGLSGIYDLVVDPRNRDTLYAIRNVFGGSKVFVSTDAAVSWTSLNANLPDLPVWKLVIDPRSGDLYIGTDRGVWQLPAGNATAGWQQFGSGLPSVQVRDLDLNQNTNTLLAGTYGRSVFLLYLDDGSSNVGALRAVSGTSTWTGPVFLVGDAAGNRTYISANGTQSLSNGIATASLDIQGSVRDLTLGTNPRLVKIGQGDVILSGVNAHGGVTEVREGALVVRNPKALGSTAANTVVNAGTALELESDLELEPVSISGDGLLFNGHLTGALRNTNNNNTYTGTLTLATDATVGVDSGSTLTIGAKAPLAGTGTITDNGSGFRFTKEGAGTLILTSANNYAGFTQINSGAVQVRNAQGLGGTAQGTGVLDGAQLQLQTPSGGPAVVVSGESLFLSGTGIFGSGALLNTGGNNRWQGPITLNSAPGFSPQSAPPGTVAFGVSAASDTLTIDGTIGEALPSGLTKVGPGALVLPLANTYTGTTYVEAGSVRLQNSQSLGGTGTSEVQRVTVGGVTTGTFTLRFGGQNTGPLAFNVPASGGVGPLASVENALNALSTIGGLGGSVTVTRTQVTTGLPTSLSPLNLFTITFGGTLVGRDLPLLGVQGNAGTTAFVTTVADGGIGTRVAAGAALELDGDPTSVGASLSVANEALALNGTGLGNTGALRNLTGLNTWTGAVLLQSNTTVGANAGTQVTVTGAVQDPTNITPLPVPSASLTKVGTGTVALTSANPYGGKTFVNQGVLNIRNAGALGTTGPETQTITVDATGTVGTFTLTFNGQTTAPLAFDVPASGGVGPTASVQNALNALSTIGGVGGSVAVTGGPPGTNVYTVTFGGTLTIGNQNPITGSGFSGVALTFLTTRDGPEGTVVASGATLQVQGGITVSTENLEINGPGFLNQGALNNASGDNFWSRDILLGSSSFIGSNVDTLTIDRAIREAAAGFSVTKVGPGTLAYAGGADTGNTYTGLTTVNEGTLVLNKTAGAVAVPSDLTIGDGVGAAGSAVARWLQSDQVFGGLITINGDGLLDLNGLAETVATLRVLDGHARTGNGGLLTVGALEMTGGTITLDGNGELALDGDVTATSSAAGEALITGPGSLSLNGTTRTFTVTDGPAATDLHIGTDTVILGLVAEGLIKTGAGRMEIDGTGAYAAPTQVLNGDLQVDGTIGDVQLQDAGASLSGTGFVGTISGGSPAVGTVAPGDNGVGNGVGTLHSGDAEWGAQTNFKVDLNAPASGGNDLLEVDGDIDLGGANLSTVIGASVAVNIPFTIIQTVNGGVISNQFAQGTTTFIDGKKYTIQYFTDRVVITRVKADVIMTATSSANPSVYGQPVIFTVTVTSESGSGTLPPLDQITFTFDTTFIQTVNIGTGTVTLDPQALIGGLPLSVGVHTLRADFLGDDDFNAGVIILTPPQQVNKSPTTILVTSAPSGLVTGQSLTLSAHVAAVIPGGAIATSLLPSGTVTFSIDGGAASAPVVIDANSDGSLTLPAGLSAGTHTVRVTYSGDGNYLTFTTPTDFLVVVVKASTTLLVGVPASQQNRGETMTFTATVSAMAPGSGFASGSVDFYFDVIDAAHLFATGSLDAGAVATVTSNTLPAGARTIFAVYAGDTSYLGSQNSNSYTVLPAVTTTALTSTLPGGSVFGQPVTFEATVTSVLPINGTPTGRVIFRVDGVEQTIVNLNAFGKATFTTNALGVGNRSIEAEYFDSTTPDSDDQFNPSFTTLTQVVGQSNTQVTSLIGTPSVSVAGEVVSFRAFVSSIAPGSGVPTGTVTFFVNGVDKGTANLVGNIATLPIAFLTAGMFNVTATYNGSGSYNSSTLTIQRQILKADTSTTVSANPVAPVSGQVVTLTAQVVPVPPGGTATGWFQPTGQVVFTVDSVARPAVNLGATGAGQLALSGLAAGQHRVSVQYLSDANHNLSSTVSDFVFTVGKANTTVAVAAPPTSVARGNPVTFTAIVTAAAPGSGTPTGSVSFYYNTISPLTLIGPSLLVNGVGSVTTSSLPAGPLTIFAVYAGDFSYLNGTGTSPYTILPAVTTTTVTTNHPVSSVFGEPVTFDALIASVIPANGVPTGEVVFSLDGVPQVPAVPVDPTGRASLTLDSIFVGSRVVTATYVDTTTPDANDQFATSVGQVTQTVVKANTAATLNLLTPIIVAGQQAVFQVTVAPVAPGAGVPDGAVTFFVNGAAAHAAALVNGTATASLPFGAAGTFNVSAQYVESANFNASGTGAQPQRVVPFASQTGITQSSAVSVFAQAVTFTATVRGGPLTGPRTQIPPGTVTFIIDGVARPAVALNGNGQAALTLPLGVGFHTAQARFNGAAQYAGSVSGTVGHNTVRANSRTVLTTARNPSYIGQDTVVVATVSTLAPGGGVPAGTVTFFVDGVARGTVALNANGRAAFNAGALPLGRHAIAAQYSGSGNHVNSATAYYQDVLNPTRMTAALVNSPVPVGTPFTLRVFAVGADGSVAPGYNAPVSFAILSAPAGGTITGTRNTTFVGGVADFGGLRLTRSGTYVIRVITGGGAIFLDLTIDTQGRLT